MTGTIHYRVKCLRATLAPSYPELLLQAQPVVRSPGVVQPLQMALQRAHIQLCVSVQVVLQQSLVDEGVLHLRGEEGRRSLVCRTIPYYFFLHLR